MSTPNPNPEDRMPVRTPGLADALRRLAGSAPVPDPTGRRGRPVASASLGRIEARAKDIYSLVQRQARLFTVVFVGTALLLGALVALQTPVFESTALLLVKTGRELIYTPEVGDQKAVESRDKQTVINSELAIMRSEPVVASVVSTVGLDKLYPDLAEQLPAPSEDAEAKQAAAVIESKAVARLRESLVVLALPDADVLQVSFRHPDGAIAQNAVNTLIDRFTEAHLGAFGEPEVVRFLEDRVSTYRDSLDTAETHLREFELKHPVFSDDLPQAALEKRLQELRGQIAAIDAQMTQVRLSAVGDNTALGQAQRERLGLEMEASRLKGKLRDSADKRIGVVKSFIDARRGELNTQIGALQQQRNDLQQQLAEAEGERTQLPTLSSQYRDLRRERDALEEQYNIYQKRLRDARTSHEMDNEKIASISVFQKATLAPEAVWPLPPMVGGVVVVVLAALLGALAATVADYYNWIWPDHWTAQNLRGGMVRVAEQARRR
jgi:uncharacterized protein involved in exopolysaccharide biosynthesis